MFQPSSSSPDEPKSDIFTVYSTGQMLSSMRIAALRCPYQIRAVYSLLEDLATQRREPSQSEFERGFSQLEQCLQSAQPDTSSCSQAKRAMTSACGRDLETLASDLEKQITGISDQRRIMAVVSRAINDLPHTGTSQHARCMDAISGFFECVNPDELAQESVGDFEKLMNIQMFMMEQQARSQGEY